MEDERDWTYSLKLYHLKCAGYITQFVQRDSFILDCGCGYGQVGKILKYSGYDNFMGFDKNRRKVDVCRALELKVFVYSIETIPFQASSVDCLICMQVFEHLDEVVYKKALREIRRVIKDDGIILLSFPIGKTAVDKEHCKILVKKDDILGAMTNFVVVEEEEVFGRYESSESKSLFVALRNASL